MQSGQKKSIQLMYSGTVLCWIKIAKNEDVKAFSIKLVRYDMIRGDKENGRETITQTFMWKKAWIHLLKQNWALGWDYRFRAAR